MPSPTFFKTPAAFRAWLHKHHASRTELILGYYKKGAARKGITYAEAVDAALCYGWIDGVVNSIDADSYMQRFTPRKPKSYWSAVNLKKVERLQQAGLMHQAGLEALERRPADSGTRYAFEARPEAFPPALARAFKAAKKAWTFFEQQPPGYRRLMIHWVSSARQEDTRLRRLEKLIEASGAGKRVT